MPLDTAVYDALYCPDHHGNPGMVRSLSHMEAVSRAALGHSAPEPLPESERVKAATGYLSANLDPLCCSGKWTRRAGLLVRELGEEITGRIDLLRIRLEFDLWRRACVQALSAADADEVQDDGINVTDEPLNPDDRAWYEDALIVPYERFQADWVAEIGYRYAAAASGPYEWTAYVDGEVRRLAAQARALLDVREHNTDAVSDCPWCGEGIGLSRDDPDLATCAGCRRQWRISSGEAGEHFAAWRRAGWDPQPW